ncbi:MAG: hypothetical protein Q7Q71_13645 [Verrucomicrobiota bacterium JB023]|nr:hypothetical protein [Verrucomicrobiota bacterium JB023]
MPEFADIYALASTRSEQAIIDFLDRFFPKRSESADEYEIPQYADSPRVVYDQVSDLIRHCCNETTEAYAVYWRAEDRAEHAMAFFLADGGLIVGISSPANEPRRVDAIAEELGNFLNTDEIIITYEELPPETTADFRSFFGSLPAHSGKTGRGQTSASPHRRVD